MRRRLRCGPAQTCTRAHCNTRRRRRCSPRARRSAGARAARAGNLARRRQELVAEQEQDKRARAGLVAGSRAQAPEVRGCPVGGRAARGRAACAAGAHGARLGEQVGHFGGRCGAGLLRGRAQVVRLERPGDGALVRDDARVGRAVPEVRRDVERGRLAAAAPRAVERALVLRGARGRMGARPPPAGVPGACLLLSGRPGTWVARAGMLTGCGAHLKSGRSLAAARPPKRARGRAGRADPDRRPDPGAAPRPAP